MPTIKLSIKQARHLAMHHQLLDNKTKLPKGREGVAQAIEHLGYVQIDTIAVIERAHHHTIWSRRPDYNENMLHKLQAKDRRVFEYWAHAAAYLPLSDYRYYLPKMKWFEDPNSKWEKQRLEKFGHMMPPVLERIKNEGALGSSDFEPPEGTKKSGWWDWRPTKVALELLFWRGELMITERRKFQRVYDLTERVLPDTVDTRYPDDDELGRFHVNRALKSFGLASEKEILGYLHVAPKNTVKQALKDMLTGNEIIQASVDGVKNPAYYTKEEYLENLGNNNRASLKVHILSPFDNFIIQRDRTQKLFDFDYTIECYVPAPKRRYGYFVLPIFYGDSFAGRLDPKADRKTKTFIIRNLHFEPDFKPSDKFTAQFASSIVKLIKFNGCEKFKIEKAGEAKYKKELTAQVKALL